MKKNSSSEIWGGRFSEAPEDIMQAVNASIDFDKRLYREDIEGSLSHAAMLARQGVIDDGDAEAICEGLRQIAAEIESGGFKFSSALEDIHMNVEARLREIIGPAAGKLHTARSRNDQVATDFRLWVRNRIDRISAKLEGLMLAHLDQAEWGIDRIMPGFTHLQNAQPVTWGHHMMAYVEMFGRDLSRFGDARSRMNESPLGAAALAGTSFPIDRHVTARDLGFDKPMANSLDAVSDRDFALEFLAAASICGVHLSRLAEELVIWSSPQFGFIAFSDKFSTGSSIMPQKRNPDAAELVRAKAGRLNGSLAALLTVMKGLPLAYSKDMQEDKEQVFDSADTLELAIDAMRGMIADLTPNPERMRAAAAAGYSTATDLADWLVRELSMSFRNAHRATGQLVKMAEDANVELADLSLADMQSVCPGLVEDARRVLTVENSVESRASYGGTAPVQVRSQIKLWRSKLK